MSDDRPALESLLRRLSECPPEFLETCMTKQGDEQVAAIIADHYRAFMPSLLTRDKLEWLGKNLRPWNDTQRLTRYWGLLSVAAWLIHDDWFLARNALAEQGWKWLSSESLAMLSELVRPTNFVSDPDRREELVRLCLNAHGCIPLGESSEQARDRLNTLDSVERQKILQATAAAERRAREIREAMARTAAMESSSRYGE